MTRSSRPRVWTRIGGGAGNTSRIWTNQRNLAESDPDLLAMYDTIQQWLQFCELFIAQSSIVVADVVTQAGEIGTEFHNFAGMHHLKNFPDSPVSLQLMLHF